MLSASAVILLSATMSLLQPPEDPWPRAAERADVAHECFVRARAVLEGWWTLKDPATGLLPRRVDHPVWAPNDNAADLFPFLVLAAHYAAPEREGEVMELLRREIELTTRLGGLPDWVALPEGRFLHPDPDVGRLIFGATEYAKDGLNPLIELLGPDPWRYRMEQLLGGVLEQAPIESDFGELPADDTEVNGELLQTLTRFYRLSGEERWIEAAETIGRAYLEEVLPRGGWLPAHRWDFEAHQARVDRTGLNDHGNEIVLGLAELFLIAKAEDRDFARDAEPALRRFYDRLIEVAFRDDGLPVSVLESSTGRVLEARAPDTWGYVLSGLVTFGQATGDPKYEAPARRALRSLGDEHLEWGGADSFADSIEGALLLLAALPEENGFAWLDAVLPRFFAKQDLGPGGRGGIVEGWYGDGNYARTALMAAFQKTQGSWLHPWRPSLRIGAARDGDALCVLLNSDEPWQGELRVDRPRHRDHYRLPSDYPRLNSFPEWFTVEPMQLYRVEIGSRSEHRLGSELIGGLPIALEAERELQVRIDPLAPPPYGQEPAPRDPFAVLGGEDPALIASQRFAQESYAGEGYAWTGRGPVTWGVALEEAPQSAVLWVRFGSKGDARRGRLTIGTGSPLEVTTGGYSGFDWERFVVPREWWDDGKLTVQVEESPGEGGAAAFVSSIRLRQVAERTEPRDGFESLYLEGEELDGPWQLQDNIEGYRGQGFRVSNADRVATTALSREVELAGGRYFVWVRAFEGHDQDRRLALSLGGRELAVTHRASERERFLWRLAGAVELEAGQHRLEVRDAGAGFECLDAIWITRDALFDPGLGEAIEQTEAKGGGDEVGALIEENAAAAEAAHQRVAAHQHDADEWLRYREDLRRQLRRALGLLPWPERTPLNARTTGVLQRDGYRIEKIVFESRPGFPVTANLYLPEGTSETKRPAVLCPVGHWGRSKAEPVVQSRCIALAKLGYVALVYDPFGQGERAVPGNGHGEYYRSTLVGRNNLSFMIWDTMRALDLLLERDDVDPERIACTGASGGGLNTLYAAALDERIRAAVPVVYVTRLRELLETRIGHCPCSHVPGLADFADMGDVLGLIAPRPCLVITASQDPSFTPTGAHRAVAQAMGAYQVLGAGAALELTEFDTGHDYDQPMREAAYAFLARHLRDAPPDVAVEEPELHLATTEELSCFESGRVPQDAETVRSLCRARAQELAGRRSDISLAQLQRLILEPSDPIVAAELVPEDRALASLRERIGLEPKARLWATSGGQRLEVRMNRAEGEATALVLWADADPEAALAQWNGRALSVDVRGPGGDRDRHLLTTNAYLLGDPWLFRRARAVASLARGLKAAEGELVAIGTDRRASMVLLWAQIAGAGFERIELHGLPGSSSSAFDEDWPQDASVFGLLELADLPELLELVSGR